jgi:excinuclease UvrABC helicase subunit UvrB
MAFTNTSVNPTINYSGNLKSTQEQFTPMQLFEFYPTRQTLGIIDIRHHSAVVADVKRMSPSFRKTMKT